MSNFLLTSSGRRGYLVKYFKDALAGKGRVFAANSTSLAPSFKYADESVVTPLVYDEEYIPFLMKYCDDNEIDVIVPLFDPDVKMLAKNKDVFEKKGIKVLTSSFAIVDIFNDKWKMYHFCVQNGFNTPETYIDIEKTVEAINSGRLSFPIVVKPRWGMGSIGIFVAENIDELRVLEQMVKRKVFGTYLKYESEEDAAHCVLFQEFVSGEEYGLDVIDDIRGNYCTTVVKKKIAMRAGETDSAMVIKDASLERMGCNFAKITKHICNMDMDVMRADGQDFVIDINMRFGGGYPFSHMSGIDLPRAIVKWQSGQTAVDELVVDEYGRIWQKDIGLIDITDI